MSHLTRVCNFDHPCAVVSRGTTKEQKVVVGTLEDISSKAKDLPTPAIIVVGEVVNLRDVIKKYQYFLIFKLFTRLYKYYFIEKIAHFMFFMLE